MGNVSLGRYKFSFIHETIRNSKSLGQAAQLLRVDDKTLAAHLHEFSYENKPVTFQLLHDLSPAKARSNWGMETYTNLMITQKVDLNIYSIARIHYNIRNSKTIDEAARRMGATDKELEDFLSYLSSNQNKPLNFQILHKMSVQKAEKIFGALTYNNQPKIFHKLSLQEAEKIFGALTYNNQPKAVTSVSSHLHSKERDEIVSSNNSNTSTETSSQASPLGTLQPTESDTNNLNLEQNASNSDDIYNQLENWLFSKDDEISIPHESYHMQEADLNQYPVTHIHNMIVNSGSQAEAAQKLGVHDETLGSHLDRFLYGPLTFQGLRNLSVYQAQLIWGPTYSQPMEVKAPSGVPHLAKAPRLFKPSEKRSLEDTHHSEENQQTLSKRPKK